MPSKVVFDWSDEQLDWFDLRYADCSSTQDQETTTYIWSRISAEFLERWPVKEMLWPSMPSSHHPTNMEMRSILEAERLCSTVHYLNDKRREDGRFMSAAHIGHWSVEQYVWLDEHRIWLVIATALEDFDTFWIILFDDFFSEWPVRRFLWPTLEDDRPLSTIQQLLVTEAEE
ncbi:hypothetical protein EDD22DRAFT_1013885 [Suillus occidentalis]|nr:hypothetical protein EDD22DRAFT_1013885 [Suillus occidentalis]